MNFFVSISANELSVAVEQCGVEYWGSYQRPTLAIIVGHLINLAGLHCSCDQLRSRGTQLTFNFFRETDSKNIFFFLTGETIFRSLFIPHETDIKNIAGNFVKEITISMSGANERLQGEILRWVNNNVFLSCGINNFHGLNLWPNKNTVRFSDKLHI